MSSENGRSAKRETSSLSEESRPGTDDDTSSLPSSRQPSPPPQPTDAPKETSTLPRPPAVGPASQIPIRKLQQATERFMKAGSSSTKSGEQSRQSLSKSDEPRSTVKRASITSELSELVESTKLSSSASGTKRRRSSLLGESSAAEQQPSTSSQSKLPSTKEVGETSSKEEQKPLLQRPSSLPIRTIIDPVQRIDPSALPMADCVADLLSTLTNSLRDLRLGHLGDEETSYWHKSTKSGAEDVYVFVETKGAQTDCKLKQCLDLMKEMIREERQTCRVPPSPISEEIELSEISVSEPHNSFIERLKLEIYHRVTRQCSQGTLTKDEGELCKLMCCLEVSVPEETPQSSTSEKFDPFMTKR